MKTTNKNKQVVSVFRKSGQIFTTSLDIAEKFGKTHRDVMRSIKNLSCSKEFRLRNFAHSYYLSSQSKKIKSYNITRDGFSFLVMGFTGNDAATWKEKYINAFNRLEQAIKRQKEPLHIQTRNDGKRIRRGQTDAIKGLAEYAKEQGSKSPDKYYMAITKMQNATLFIADKAKSENMRDLLNTDQLFLIGTADQLIAQVIRDGIKMGMPYKDIFQASKRKVIAFAELVGVSEVPSLGLLGHNSQHALEDLREVKEEDAATSPSKPESCKNQRSGA